MRERWTDEHVRMTTEFAETMRAMDYSLETFSTVMDGFTKALLPWFDRFSRTAESAAFGMKVYHLLNKRWAQSYWNGLKEAGDGSRNVAGMEA